MHPKKILAIKLRALGDTVLATAPLIELQGAFPSSEIHALVPQEWAPLLKNFNGINKIWPYQRRMSKLARTQALARLAFSLRQEQFDCVINFHASPTSAFLGYLTGASCRAIHFHGHRHPNRFSTVEIPGKGILKPIIERDMDALRGLGLHIPAGRLPRITLQQYEVDEAQDTLSQLNLSQPLLAISPGASRKTKTWPVTRYVDLAMSWARDQGGYSVVLTGPHELELERQFLAQLDEQLNSEYPEPSARSQIRGRISLIHAPPLRKLAALLQQASVWVGSDSGPKHLAIAVDTPTVTLFGPEDPYEWHPYPLDKNPYLFHGELNCRRDADPGMPAWCGLKVCTIEENRCMTLIGVDSVLTECKKVARV